MVRLLSAGPLPTLDPRAAPAEAALQLLGMKLLGSNLEGEVEAAFKSLDLDSSRRLDLVEVAAAARKLLPGGNDPAVRLVVAYAFLHVASAFRCGALPKLRTWLKEASPLRAMYT